MKKLEAISSISWFLMDFFWFQDFIKLSLIFASISIILMLIICFKEKTFVNFALTNWLLMNVNWILNVNDIGLICGIVGLFCVIFSLGIGEKIENFIRLKFKK